MSWPDEGDSSDVPSRRDLEEWDDDFEGELDLRDRQRMGSSVPSYAPTYRKYERYDDDFDFSDQDESDDHTSGMTSHQQDEQYDDEGPEFQSDAGSGTGNQAKSRGRVQYADISDLCFGACLVNKATHASWYSKRHADYFEASYFTMPSSRPLTKRLSPSPLRQAHSI
jgi:hypothetical protein